MGDGEARILQYIGVFIRSYYSLIAINYLFFLVRVPDPNYHHPIWGNGDWDEIKTDYIHHNGKRALSLFIYNKITPQGTSFACKEPGI